MPKKCSNSCFSENWKKNYRLNFGKTYMEFDGCHRNVKNDGHTIDILKFPQRMKKKLLKVQLRIIFNFIATQRFSFYCLDKRQCVNLFKSKCGLSGVGFEPTPPFGDQNTRYHSDGKGISP